MPRRDDIISLLERIAHIADRVQHKLVYVIAVGVVVSGYLAWSWYSSSAALWLNVLKCSVVALPTLIWVFIWSVLAQLQEAPSLAAKLLQDDQGVFSNAQALSLTKPNGLTGVFNTLRAFRGEGGLGIVFDSIGGIGLLANPFFMVLVIAASVLMFLLISVAMLVLIF